MLERILSNSVLTLMSPPNKKGHHKGDLFYLARPERFERPTLGFVARHAIDFEKSSH